MRGSAGCWTGTWAPPLAAPPKRRGELLLQTTRTPAEGFILCSAASKLSMRYVYSEDYSGFKDYVDDQVSLASAPGRNNYVAIKSVTKTRGNAATIRRERQILMLARDCPFLCHLYAAQQSQDQAFFITEYLSGGSLKDLLNKCGRLNTDQVRFYTAEIACGLQFLHGHNIVHRDIKPDNIMLDRDGHIRIIDLGLARDGVTSSNKICGAAGTLPYMAPEVFQREYYTAVDWWSLGIVVSQMSARCFPFYYGGDKVRVRHSIINVEPNIPSWLPADLQHLMTDLLCKNPEKRLGVYNNIRDHPFFNTINWEELEQRRAQPPFIPPMAALNEEDLQWPEVKSARRPLKGFDYITPSWAWKDQPMATAQSSVPPDPCLSCCIRPRRAYNILSTVLRISIKLSPWILPLLYILQYLAPPEVPLHPRGGLLNIT